MPPIGPPPRPRVDPASRAPGHGRILVQIQETQDWLGRLRDEVHGLQEQLKSTHGTPPAPPPPAPGSELAALRAERDRLRAELDALTARGRESDRRLAAELDAARHERDRLAALRTDRRAEDEAAGAEPAAAAKPDAVRDERDRLRARVAQLERQTDEAHRLEARLRADLGRVNNLWAHLEEGQAAAPPPAPPAPEVHPAVPLDATRLERVAAEVAAVQASGRPLPVAPEPARKAVAPPKATPEAATELAAALAERDR
ncbi:MAG TPA: hypothetical protein VF590_18445, partial [Isosphaeraceae bacterium]